MDAIAWVMMTLLNLNEPCTAMPAYVQKLGGQEYQILHFQCGERHFKVWQKRCDHEYWGRPFLLVDDNTQEGLYMNQFGEVVRGYHIPLVDTYVPLCGS